MFTDVAGNSNVATSSISRSYDSTSPMIINVMSSNVTGTYSALDLITINVNFSEVVELSVNGSMTLALNSSGIATYVSGSGSNILTFHYNVSEGDFPLILIIPHRGRFLFQGL